MPVQCEKFRLGWVCGILDGEGCFSLRKISDTRYQGIITLANTNKKIIDKYCGILRDWFIDHAVYYKRSASPIGKPYWAVEVKNNTSMMWLLTKLKPYMDCRKEQVETLLMFVNRRMSRPSNEKQGQIETELFLRLRELNKRGMSE